MIVNSDPVVKTLADICQSSYAAFWADLSDWEKDLTWALTSEENRDAVVVVGADVWLFHFDSEGNVRPELWGSSRDLVLYANTENTALPESRLDDFVSELARRVPVIKVQTSKKTSVKWLRENERISETWDAALALVA